MSGNRLRLLAEGQSTGDEIIRTVNALMRGRIGTTGSVTLATDENTTGVSDSLVTSNSVILLMPLTASAAAVSYHISCQKRAFTIHHDQQSDSDRRFKYVVFGG